MEPMPRRNLVLAALGFEGGLAGLALGLGWLFDQPLGAAVRADANAALLGVAVCLPMLAGFAVCLLAPWGPLRRLRSTAEEAIRAMFAHATLFDLAWISLLAGVAEELFFRGFLQ